MKASFTCVHKLVRKSTKRHGWNPERVFVDKRKGGHRRISYVWGGPTNSKQRATIHRAVTQALHREFGDRIVSIWWVACEGCWSSYYPRLCVRVAV